MDASSTVLKVANGIRRNRRDLINGTTPAVLGVALYFAAQFVERLLDLLERQTVAIEQKRCP